MPKIRGIDYQQLVDALNKVGINTDTNEATLTVVPSADFTATGTTSANASTTITGVSTIFLTEIGVGDRIALSSASGTFGTVTAIASNTSLTVSPALGNGTSQTITVKKAPLRVDTRSLIGALFLNDLGNMAIGQPPSNSYTLEIAGSIGATTTSSQLTIGSLASATTAPVATFQTQAGGTPVLIKLNNPANRNVDRGSAIAFFNPNGSGSSQVGAQIISANSDSTPGGAEYLKFQTGVGGVLSDVLKLDASLNGIFAGSVSVGSGAVPTSKFYVSDGVNRNPSLTTGAASCFNFNNAGGEFAGGLYSTSPFNYWLQARGASASKDLILQPLGGNIAIGTAATAQKRLTVRDPASASTTVGNAEVIRVCGGGSNPNNLSEIGFTYGAGFGDNFSPVVIGYQYTSGSGFTLGDIYFATRSVTTDTAPTERVRIDSVGSLLVGFASSPDTIHKIWNTSTTNPTLDVRNINTSASSDSTQAITITKGSTTNTAGTNNFIVFQINNGGTTSGKISTNGASAAAFFSASDQRLKKDIVPMTGALELIGKLNPVSFSWKENNQRRNGFIAQELAGIMPELVSKTDDGVGEELPKGQEPWAMTDSGMIPYLVKAIQELKTQLDKLSTLYNQNCIKDDQDGNK